MDDTFSQIRAAAIDGRAINIFYRQKQLEQLCNALIKRSPEIREAIAADYGHSPTEIAVELHSALQSVKRDYESLRPDEEHKREYLIAAGKDARSVKKLAGIVYVQPCTHTLFYSVIVPLSAAIAAGNCVIVLVSNTQPLVTDDRILTKSLSWRTTCGTYRPFYGKSSHLRWTGTLSPSPKTLLKTRPYYTQPSS